MFVFAGEVGGKKQLAARSPRGEGGSADEFVAGAVDGEDVLGFVGRTLDLLPELRHEVVDGARGRRLLVAPDLIQDLLAGDDLAGVRDEIPQQVEFPGREVDPLTGTVRLVSAEIDFDVADAAGLQPGRPAAGATKDGADASEQFGDAERL